MKLNDLLKIFVIILIALISMLIIFSKPTITLKGKQEMSIDLGEVYNDPGYYANILIFNKTDMVKVDNDIDNTKIGTYEVKYSLEINNYKIVKKRKVKVVDREKPVISLNGNGVTCPNSEYVEEGYKVIDNYDGDITDKLKIKKEKDVVKYIVFDSSGNKEEVTRKIFYEDKENPHIALYGESTINVNLGDSYIEPGYLITDNCDLNISNKINIVGNVNTDQIGEYTLNYTVIDESGNETTVVRTIKVINPLIAPDIDGRGKTIYLTFDDGPSASITPYLLQILKEENIKATFFVINHNDSLNYLIKQEYNEGHTVALHSYTHNYSYIYSSISNYFSDLDNIRNKVYNITGVYSNIIRFPGGTSNTVSRRYNQGIMSALTQEVVNKGYYYFDWNVSSEDAGGAYSKEDVYNNVVRNLVYKDNVVLLHDFEGNYKTLNAIRDIIKYGKRNGYTFKVIDENTQAIRHRTNN